MLSAVARASIEQSEPSTTLFFAHASAELGERFVRGRIGLKRTTHTVRTRNTVAPRTGAGETLEDSKVGRRHVVWSLDFKV